MLHGHAFQVSKNIHIVSVLSEELCSAGLLYPVLQAGATGRDDCIQSAHPPLPPSPFGCPAGKAAQMPFVALMRLFFIKQFQ
jgi:hypothetical protein